MFLFILENVVGEGAYADIFDGDPCFFHGLPDSALLYRFIEFKVSSWETPGSIAMRIPPFA